MWKVIVWLGVAGSQFFANVFCRLPTEPDLVQAYTDIEYQVSGTQFLRWSVEIYENTDGDRRHKCGGSLVTPSTVISAARCFWGEGAEGGPLPASQFTVARTYGGLSSGTVWAAVQKANVSAIHIPPSYRDRAGLYADDIAVVALSEPLVGVTPICVSFEDTCLADGSYGRNMGTLQLAGQGLPSPLFTALEVRYASRERCANGSEPYFLEQLTEDKICAGFKPGAGGTAASLVCRGDAGSGLASYSGAGHAAVPRLRGVGSTPFPDPGPYGTVTGCATFRYAAFTLVSAHRAFLQRHVPGVEAECARYYTTASASASANPAHGDQCNCHCHC
ncbi:uncharacterized protein LOC134666976 [Cydia fagiglandana]|uniref:uncharacterized protein LOC134666976 n=1 Tax=Cydia fagiglandana TaxID=1458189 RepID=UPI002FEE6408